MTTGGTDDSADDADADIEDDSDPLNNMTDRCDDCNARVANKAMHRDDALLKHTPFQGECRPVPKRAERLNSHYRVFRY